MPAENGSILVRRGPTSDRDAFTPLNGEIIYDTTTGQLHVGDASTAGGTTVFGDKVKVAGQSGIAGDITEKGKVVQGPMAFDIRDFHEVVLEQGTVTLAILEDRINNHINKRKNE